MRLVILLSALFFVVTPAAAMGSIFDIFNETAYNDSLDIVTEYQEPNKTVQAHKHIRGWIDIVGFKQIVRINGIDYCNNSEPIIEYKLWDGGLHWNNNLDYIEITDKRIFTEGNNTTVEFDIYLKWHHSELKSRTVCGLNGRRTYKWISKTYYREYMTLSASAEAPQQFQNNTDATANIIIYNNTINPHVDIYVPVYNTTTKTVYAYDGETITRRTLSGVSAVGAVNFTECLYWEDDSDLFAYKNDVAVLKNMNESEFDLSKLTITMHDPYEIRQIEDLNMSTVELDPNKPFNNPKVFVTFALLIVFGWGIKKSFDVCGDLI